MLNPCMVHEEGWWKQSIFLEQTEHDWAIICLLLTAAPTSPVDWLDSWLAGWLFYLLWTEWNEWRLKQLFIDAWSFRRRQRRRFFISSWFLLQSALENSSAPFLRVSVSISHEFPCSARLFGAATEHRLDVLIGFPRSRHEAHRQVENRKQIRLTEICA